MKPITKTLKGLRLTNIRRKNSLVLLASLLLVVSSYKLHAGLIQGYAVIIPATKDRKEKHLYLFGDHHTVGSREPQDSGRTDMVAPSEAQHDEFLEALKESGAYRNNKPLVIFFEKASIFGPRIVKNLLHLDLSMEHEDLPNVRVEDAEVRQISVSAYAILRDYGRCCDKGIIHHVGGKPADQITFQDVLDEFDQIYEDLTQFRMTHPTPLAETFHDFDIDDPFYGFDWTYKQLAREIQKFKEYFSEQAIDLTARPYYFANEKDNTDKITKLCGRILSIGSNLMDLSLFKRIVLCKEEHIALIAGGGHIGLVKGMLGDFKTKTINIFNPLVAYHLPKEELLEFMLSKRDLHHIFIEYTYFCTLLKKLFSSKSDVEIALMRNSILHHCNRVIHLENSKVNIITLLTIVGILCIIIRRNNLSTNNKNKQEEILDETLNTTSTKWDPALQS